MLLKQLQIDYLQSLPCLTSKQPAEERLSHELAIRNFIPKMHAIVSSAQSRLSVIAEYSTLNHDEYAQMIVTIKKQR
jgi:hypothetical protein